MNRLIVKSILVLFLSLYHFPIFAGDHIIVVDAGQSMRIGMKFPRKNSKQRPYSRQKYPYVQEIIKRYLNQISEDGSRVYMLFYHQGVVRTATREFTFDHAGNGKKAAHDHISKFQNFLGAGSFFNDKGFGFDPFSDKPMPNCIWSSLNVALENSKYFQPSDGKNPAVYPAILLISDEPDDQYGLGAWGYAKPRTIPADNARQQKLKLPLLARKNPPSPDDVILKKYPWLIDHKNATWIQVYYQDPLTDQWMGRKPIQWIPKNIKEVDDPARVAFIPPVINDNLGNIKKALPDGRRRILLKPDEELKLGAVFDNRLQEPQWRWKRGNGEFSKPIESRQLATKLKEAGVYTVRFEGKLPAGGGTLGADTIVEVALPPGPEITGIRLLKDKLGESDGYTAKVEVSATGKYKELKISIPGIEAPAAQEMAKAKDGKHIFEVRLAAPKDRKDKRETLDVTASLTPMSEEIKAKDVMEELGLTLMAPPAPEITKIELAKKILTKDDRYTAQVVVNVSGKYSKVEITKISVPGMPDIKVPAAQEMVKGKDRKHTFEVKLSPPPDDKDQKPIEKTMEVSAKLIPMAPGADPIVNPPRSLSVSLVPQIPRKPLDIAAGFRLQRKDAKGKILDIKSGDAIWVTEPDGIKVNFKNDSNATREEKVVDSKSELSHRWALNGPQDQNKTLTDYEPMDTTLQPGEYNLKLAVTENGKPKNVKVAEPVKFVIRRVEAKSGIKEFKGEKYDAQMGDPVQFQADWTGPEGAKFKWEFGDGKTSAEQNPKHTYQKATGEKPFEAKVTVTMPDGTVLPPATVSSKVFVTKPTIAAKPLAGESWPGEAVKLALRDDQLKDVEAVTWFVDGKEIQGDPKKNFEAAHVFTRPGENDVKFTVKKKNLKEPLESKMKVQVRSVEPVVQNPIKKVFIGENITLNVGNKLENGAPVPFPKGHEVTYLDPDGKPMDPKNMFFKTKGVKEIAVEVKLPGAKGTPFRSTEKVKIQVQDIDPKIKIIPPKQAP